MSEPGGGSAPVGAAAAVAVVASPASTSKIGAKANWGKVRCALYQGYLSSVLRLVMTI